jgi:hypothetical protein
MVPHMFIVIEENPNCEPQERVFSTTGAQKTVTHLNLESPRGETKWWEVAGLDENGKSVPAQAIQVEDSSDGIAWLVFGGSWGLRMRDSNEEWSVDNQKQWGVPFKVLDISASAIRFKFS